MSKQERRIIVRPIPREEIDLRRLARCIIDLAIDQQRREKEQQAAAAEAEHEQEAA